MSAFRLRVGVVAAGLCCFTIAYAWAQQQQLDEAERPEARQIDELRTPEAREHRAEFRAEPGRAQNQELTQYLANRLIAKNEAEVEIYQLAQQQAESDEVQRFAQEAMQDHQQLIQQLQQLAGPQVGPRQPGQPLGAPGQPDVQREAARPQPGAQREAIQPQQPGVARTPGAAQIPGQDQALQQLTQIDRQIIQRANQTLREELQQKDGVEFDKAFLANQVGTHIHMLATLEVIGQQGPDELRQVAQQARSDVQQHLEEAKQLKQRLDRQPGARAEREPVRTR